MHIDQGGGSPNLRVCLWGRKEGDVGPGAGAEGRGRRASMAGRGGRLGCVEAAGLGLGQQGPGQGSGVSPPADAWVHDAR